MARHKEFTITKTEENARIDVMLEIKKGKIIHFCINLVWIENEKTHDIYRVDTYHGFLHEQRFWISKEKIKLDMDWHYAFDLKLKEVKEKYMEWIKLFKERRKRK